MEEEELQNEADEIVSAPESLTAIENADAYAGGARKRETVPEIIEDTLDEVHEIANESEDGENEEDRWGTVPGFIEDALDRDQEVVDEHGRSTVPGIIADALDEVQEMTDKNLFIPKMVENTLDDVQGRIEEDLFISRILDDALTEVQEKTEKEIFVPKIVEEVVDEAVQEVEKQKTSELNEEASLEEMEEEEEEEEEEKEGEPKIRHYLLDLYGVPERKERFNLTFDYMECCLQRQTDGRRILILRGNELILELQRRLDDNDMDILCKFLKTRPDIIELDVAYNAITDYGMEKLVDLLSSMTTLERLNIMCNDIGDRGVEKLALLGDNMPLEVLRVCGNNLGHKGGKNLASILRAKNKLQYLDIGQTSQRLSSLMYYIDALMTNKQLIYLNISRPLAEPMVCFDSGHWADVLGHMLQVNRTLRELYLQKSSLSCHDVERMMDGLSRNSTLLLLDLSCNNVGDHGAAALAAYVRTRPALVALLLERNIITDIGARSLSRDIPNSCLQLLDLSYNRLTDEGVQELLMTLRKPVMMRGLYLWGNAIGQTSCKVLRRMLDSGVLQRDGVDVEVYSVDGRDYCAHRPMDGARSVYNDLPPSRFHRWGWPPPKRPSPHPALARICPRRPFAERSAPFEQRCLETGTHARLPAVPPRRCR